MFFRFSSTDIYFLLFHSQSPCFFFRCSFGRKIEKATVAGSPASSLEEPIALQNLPAVVVMERLICVSREVSSDFRIVFSLVTVNQIVLPRCVVRGGGVRESCPSHLVRKMF